MMHKKKCICHFTFVKTFKIVFQRSRAKRYVHGRGSKRKYMRILVNSESETRNNLETEVRETFRKIHRTCSSLNLLFWAPGTREPNILLLKTWIRIVKVFIEMSQRHTFSSYFNHPTSSTQFLDLRYIHREDWRKKKTRLLKQINFHVNMYILPHYITNYILHLWVLYDMYLFNIHISIIY